MKAKDLDKIFNDGEVDIHDHLDLSKAFRPGLRCRQKKRFYLGPEVDFIEWLVVPA